MGRRFPGAGFVVARPDRRTFAAGARTLRRFTALMS